MTAPSGQQHTNPLKTEREAKNAYNPLWTNCLYRAVGLSAATYRIHRADLSRSAACRQPPALFVRCADRGVWPVDRRPNWPLSLCLSRSAACRPSAGTRAHFRRATQRPHVVMATKEPLHTWQVGLSACFRDVLPVTRNPPYAMLLLRHNKFDTSICFAWLSFIRGSTNWFCVTVTFCVDSRFANSLFY